MKRTTIVLPDDLATLLDWERRRRGVSAAEIVREALDAHLNRPTGPLPFIGIGRSGQRDTAARAEEILAEEWTYERLMGKDDVPEEGGLVARSRHPDKHVADEAHAQDQGSRDDHESSGLVPPKPRGDTPMDERRRADQDGALRDASTASGDPAIGAQGSRAKRRGGRS